MFKFSDTLYYSMPAHFSGFEQSKLYYDDATALIISYETDREMLLQYIPEGFELLEPLVQIGYVMCRGVQWMAGGSYNLIAVQVPAAYTGGAQRIEGGYVLVIWENKACPILGGREQTGMPKLFADIEDHHQMGERMFTNVSYEGTSFLRMDFTRTRKLTVDELSALNQREATMNWLGWRYIPNIGKPGAALSHATLYPIDYTYTEVWAGEGKVQWQELAWEQHPNQFGVINALRQLPIKSYGGCRMARQRQVMRVDLARQLP
jgi:acetoacetate decarboxylase